MIRLLLITCCFALASAADLDALISNHNAERIRTIKTYEDDVSAATQRLTRSLQGIAASATRAGNLGEAAEAWKEILRFDSEYSEARAFFEATGTLDTVLAEVSDPRQPPSVKAQGATMPGNSQRIEVAAGPNGEVQMGRVAAGTTLFFQYDGGSWGQQGETPTSPDDPQAPNRLRLALVDLTSTPPTLIAVVPPGTASAPASVTMPRDVDNVGLWMMPLGVRAVNRSSGTVAYKIAAKKR